MQRTMKRENADSITDFLERVLVENHVGYIHDMLPDNLIRLPDKTGALALYCVF